MIILRKSNIGLTLGWNEAAGLFCFWFNLFGYGFSIHLFIKKKFWFFGVEEDYFNGPIKLFCLGPLFLISIQKL